MGEGSKIGQKSVSDCLNGPLFLRGLVFGGIFNHSEGLSIKGQAWILSPEMHIRLTSGLKPSTKNKPRLLLK
jgi:hypothetical protein